MASSVRTEFRCRPISPVLRFAILTALILGAVIIFVVLAPRMGLLIPALIAVVEVVVGMFLFCFLKVTAERQARQRIAFDPAGGLFTLRHFVLHEGGKPANVEDQVTLSFDEVRSVRRQQGGAVVHTARGDFFLSPNWIGFDELVCAFEEMTGDRPAQA